VAEKIRVFFGAAQARDPCAKLLAEFLVLLDELEELAGPAHKLQLVPVDERPRLGLAPLERHLDQRALFAEHHGARPFVVRHLLAVHLNEHIAPLHGPSKGSRLSAIRSATHNVGNVRGTWVATEAVRAVVSSTHELRRCAERAVANAGAPGAPVGSTLVRPQSSVAQPGTISSTARVSAAQWRADITGGESMAEAVQTFLPESCSLPLGMLWNLTLPRPGRGSHCRQSCLPVDDQLSFLADQHAGSWCR